MPGDNLTDATNNQAQAHQNPEARGILNFLALNQNDQSAAPSTQIGKYAEVTGKGLLELPRGIGQSIIDDVTNPVETAKMVATSAALGLTLKMVLPEGGSVGKIAGLAIGGYFLGKAASPIISAYGEAGSAKTMGDLNKAANDLGMAGGSFIVNSGVGMVGYKIGAGLGGRIMDSQTMDGFAEQKANFWNGVETKVNSGLDSVKSTVLRTAPEAAIESKAAPDFVVNGDRATLMKSMREAPKNAKLLGDLNPDDQMSVTVLAQTKGSPFLMDRYLKRMGEGAAPLTDAEITEKFGTDLTSKAAIEKFAGDHGLTMVDENLASGRMILKGSTAQMQDAFGVKLQQFETEDGGVKFRGREGALNVPAEVAPHIKGVLGLDNRPQFKTNYVKLSDLPAGATQAEAVVDAAGKAGPKPAAGARALDVDEVFKAYNADPSLTGKGMTTGYLSLGGDMPSTWNDYMKSKGIDPSTFEKRLVAGADPTPDPNGADGENALDGVIHKMGMPLAKTVMIQAANSDSGMPDGIDRMTFPKAGESQITHGSISWGMFEDGWTDQARAAMEDAGKRAALKGITITVASGDNGVGDGSRSGKPQVDIPAGLEHFTGAGGTMLILQPNGTWGSEKAWSGMGATGGGVSLKTPIPDFQAGVKIPANLGGGNFKGRGVPDFAFDGDPRSGINTPLESGIEPIGGTSAAAPEGAIAGAKISQGTGTNTGYWNPKLYALGKSNPEVYHDITVGNNTDSGMTGYKAGPGWDATTGWGSINIGKYIDVIGKQASRNFFQRETAQVPDYIKNNNHVWAVPFQTSVVPNDNNNK